MDIELKKDIVDSLKVIRKIVNKNLDKQDNPSEGLSAYYALNLCWIVTGKLI